MNTLQKLMLTKKRGLDRLVNRRAAPAMQSLLQRHQSGLLGSLSKVAKGNGAVTPTQVKRMIGVVRPGIVDLVEELIGALAGISREAQVEALRSVAGDINMLGHYDIMLPVEEVGKFRTLANQAADALETYNVKVSTSLGDGLIDRIQRELTMGMASQESAIDSIARVESVTDGMFGSLDRLARTETMWAYNDAQARGTEACQEALPDLMLRWTEFVNDETGAPVDEKTAEDSLAMHGQVVEPGELFVMPEEMPDGSPVSKRSAHLVGLGWDHPPNRPNDRAIVLPWQKEWGIPAWKYEKGRRVDIG